MDRAFRIRGARTQNPAAGLWRWRAFLALAGAAGLFFGLPNARLHLPFLALLYPFCLYLLSGLVENGKKALLWGWLAGLAANAACLYWLVYPMHDVAGIPFILAIPTALLLHAYLACYAALALYSMWGLRRLCANGAQGASRPQTRITGGLARGLARLLPPLAGGLVFAGLEVACSYALSGFPWLTLSTALAFDPLWTQTASLFGARGLSALMACAACCAAASLPAGGEKARALPAVAALLLFFLPAGYGLSVFSAAKNASTHDAPVLSLIMVQGNIDQNRKWDPEFQQSTLDHYLALSRAALEEARRAHPDRPPALVVWPETAMPFYFPLHRDYARSLWDFAGSEGLYLAFGALGVKPEAHKDGLRNRFLLLPPKGPAWSAYDKRHLVPFGEYLPLAPFFPYLQDLLQGMDFSPGDSAAPLILQPGSVWPLAKGPLSLSLGVLICYEAIFPELAAESVAAGADVLLNVSNDGWFRKSSAPYQHLAHAVLRAVEQRRPLVRATNTGISAVVSPLGEITALSDALFEAATLRAEVVPQRENSLYQRLRPLPELFLLFCALAGLAAALYASSQLRKITKQK